MALFINYRDGEYFTKHPLIDKFKQWLIEDYCTEYTAEVEVLIEGDVYSMAFEMNNDRTPYIISGDFANEDSFFEYVKKTFKPLIKKAKYYKIKMLDRVNDNEVCTTEKE